MFFIPGTHKEHGLPYSPLKAIVTPRPIGWISTIDKEGPGCPPPAWYKLVNIFDLMLLQILLNFFSCIIY